MIRRISLTIGVLATLVTGGAIAAHAATAVHLCYTSRGDEQGNHFAFVSTGIACPPGTVELSLSGSAPTVTTYVNSGSGTTDVSCNSGDVATGGGAAEDRWANGGNGGYLTVSRPNVATGRPTGWHAEAGQGYATAAPGYLDNGSFSGQAPTSIYVVCQHIGS